MTDRTQTSSNDYSDEVVLAIFPATVFGIGNPESVGVCGLSLTAYDQNDHVLDLLPLFPGESQLRSDSPTGTYRITMRRFSGCTAGPATLEYDTPNA